MTRFYRRSRPRPRHRHAWKKYDEDRRCRKAWRKWDRAEARRLRRWVWFYRLVPWAMVLVGVVLFLSHLRFWWLVD